MKIARSEPAEPPETSSDHDALSRTNVTNNTHHCLEGYLISYLNKYHTSSSSFPNEKSSKPCWFQIGAAGVLH